MAKKKEAPIETQEAPKAPDNLNLSNPGATTTRKKAPKGLQPIGTSGTLFVQHN